MDYVRHKNYDEAWASLTTSLTGRTVDRVERHGKELHFYMTCGHVVILQSDVNGDIHHKRTDCKLVLVPLIIDGEIGKL